MANQMTQVIDTPTELDDRDLDLVAGGWGESVTYNQGNTGQVGLLNVSLLNGNNVNVLGLQSIL